MGLEEPTRNSAALSTDPAPSKRNSVSIDDTHEYMPSNISRLGAPDLAIVRRALGGISDSESSGPVHPTSFIYPPKGLPDGLYKDTIRARTVSQYQYFFCSLFFNTSLILQILLGAALTALGARASTNDVVITILAAGNTVNAGLLALMHNSGLPDRFKNDTDEFDGVVQYLRELMDSGIVKEGMNRDQAIDCAFTLFRRAKSTVATNKPSAYAKGSSPTGQDSTAPAPSPRLA